MENSNLQLIKEIVINDPPTFYQIYRKKKSALEGRDIYDKYYLTANLFFNNATSYHIISRIVEDTKIWLKEQIGILPELEKMSLEIEYRANKHIDLDNKAFFWKKLFLDIIKTPSQKQLANAKLKNKLIITTNTIKDDTTQYIDSISEKFIFGGHCLIFRVYGRAAVNQTKMNLY